MYGQLISSVTVGAGGASGISFTAIPSNFTDLVLVISARVSNNSSASSIGFNSDYGANYASRFLTGNGSTVSSGTGSTDNIYWYAQSGSATTASTFSSTICHITNYSGSTAKGVSIDSASENNATANSMYLTAGVYTPSTAISSIQIGGLFVQYSTATLYGLTKGSGGATVS